MAYRHTKKEDTLPREDFDKLNLAEIYTAAMDYYPEFTRGDPDRLKALDWLISELRAKHNNGPPPYCIDLGCAHGQPVLQKLAEQGFDVTGVDITPGLLDQARHNLAHLHNVKFELADFRAWQPPLDKRSAGVDCITTFYVLNHFHLDEYKRVVDTFTGWLKPGGVMIFATVAQVHGWVEMRQGFVPFTSLSIEDNTALLEKNGCVVEKAWESMFTSSKPDTNDEDRRIHQFLCVRKK